ncbi:MAG: hypothetical protein ACT4O1_18235 [Gemmatimonadota bacterium]
MGYEPADPRAHNRTARACGSGVAYAQQGPHLLGREFNIYGPIVLRGGVVCVVFESDKGSAIDCDFRRQGGAIRGDTPKMMHGEL